MYFSMHFAMYYMYFYVFYIFCPHTLIIFVVSLIYYIKIHNKIHKIHSKMHNKIHNKVGYIIKMCLVWANYKKKLKFNKQNSATVCKEEHFEKSFEFELNWLIIIDFKIIFFFWMFIVAANSPQLWTYLYIFGS